jgi:hypothetical protein
MTLLTHEAKTQYLYHLRLWRVKASRLSRDLIFGFFNVQPHFWLYLALIGPFWLFLALYGFLWLFMALANKIKDTALTLRRHHVHS